MICKLLAIATLVSGLGAIVACSGGNEGGASPPGGDASAAGDGYGLACTANMRECVDERVARVCANNGDWVPVPCRGGERCDKGACGSAVEGGKTCVAGKTQCLSDAIVGTCTPDGDSWVPTVCAQTDQCIDGVCRANAAVACTPGEGDCVGGTPFRCKADGSGYDTTPCPAATSCTGAGLCKGSLCVAGASYCISTSKVGTCSGDGSTATESACAFDQVCIASSAASTAACKPKGCPTVDAKACGNKLDSAADPTKYYSTCVATPDGWKWNVVKCDGALMCTGSGASVGCASECAVGATACSGANVVSCGNDGKWAYATSKACTAPSTCVVTPAGTSVCGDSACAFGAAGACTSDGKLRKCVDGNLQPESSATECATGKCSSGACVAECADGDTKCLTATDARTGVITCQNGRWPTTLGTTVCSTPTNSVQACVTLITNKKAVCGDPTCVSGSGICTSAGLFRPCSEGRLVDASLATACPNGGTCTGSACLAPQCKTGDTQCATTVGYRTCVDARWSSTITDCPAADTGLERCTNSVTASGPRALCGTQCTPGARMCEPGSPKSTALRVCGMDGKWGPPTTCTYGVCLGASPTATCTAECVPGEFSCAGTSSTVAGVGQLGWSATATCTSNGTLPTATTLCTSGTYCRKNDIGKALGCLACVGGRNEIGFADVKCDVAGTATLACSQTNTWGLAKSCNGAVCKAATAFAPASCGTSTFGQCASCMTTFCDSLRTNCQINAAANCSALEQCFASCSGSAGCAGACWSLYSTSSGTPSYNLAVCVSSSCANSQSCGTW